MPEPKAERPDDPPDKRVRDADHNENNLGRDNARWAVTGRGYLARERARDQRKGK